MSIDNRRPVCMWLTTSIFGTLRRRRITQRH